MAIFQSFFSRQYRPRKCFLRYSRTRKAPFYPIKTRSSESPKLEIFPKGLTHGFGQKMAIFLCFFFGSIGQEIVFNDILERKNTFLTYKSKKFIKSKNWDYSQGLNRWFWSKNGHFSIFFFFGNIGQENVFNDILERKNDFLAYKSKKFKKSKNWDFIKGVNPWFWSKMAIFPCFF